MTRFQNLQFSLFFTCAKSAFSTEKMSIWTLSNMLLDWTSYSGTLDVGRQYVENFVVVIFADTLIQLFCIFLDHLLTLF